MADSDYVVAARLGLSEDSLYFYRLDEDHPNRKNPSEESIARALGKCEKRLRKVMGRSL